MLSAVLSVGMEAVVSQTINVHVYPDFKEIVVKQVVTTRIIRFDLHISLFQRYVILRVLMVFVHNRINVLANRVGLVLHVIKVIKSDLSLVSQ